MESSCCMRRYPKAVSKELGMAELNIGDRIRVKDRPNYTLSGWEGEVVEVKEDPKGWIIMRADKTGYRMAFPDIELEKL